MEEAAGGRAGEAGSERGLGGEGRCWEWHHRGWWGKSLHCSWGRCWQERGAWEEKGVTLEGGERG